MASRLGTNLVLDVDLGSADTDGWLASLAGIADVADEGADFFNIQVLLGRMHQGASLQSDFGTLRQVLMYGEHRFACCCGCQWWRAGADKRQGDANNFDFEF